MSVVGLDLGNENLVIAAAGLRGIDVLLNGESSRETPATVSFGDNQRSIGGTAVATNPKSTISQIKRLLGREFNDPTVQNDLRSLPFLASESPDGGILIRVRYLDQDMGFTPVQILAMLMSHLKQIAEKNLESTVCDCVIGIPCYATDLQRRLYLDAAQIAGLRPLRLMHDVAATALGYGFYRVESQFKGEAVYVVFVDIGHCDTQVAVAEFQRGQMRILSHASDSCLGGRDFDEVLFRYFSEKFKEEYKIDVNSNLRAGIRLRAACEKVKKVLSANAEAPLSIECLMEEKDVKGFIKREEFERLSSELVERIAVPCQRAMENSGLSIGKVFSVELVGSGSRIPAVKRRLSDLFQREPSRTLNASECVARGCALQCAMLSSTFRVKDYEVQDSFPFSIGLMSDEGPVYTSSRHVIFPRGQPIPSVKLLTFQRNNTFHLEAFYGDPSELPPGVSERISNFKIGPFHGSDLEKQRVKVRIRLNLHGFVTVESASLIKDIAIEFVPEQPDSKSGIVEDGDSSLHESGLHAPRVDGSKKHRPSRRVEVPVSETVYGGMTKAELSEAQVQELHLTNHDKMVERTKENKNAVEAFVYEKRNKLLGEYRSFVSDTEREEISRNLLQTEEWLYDDGDNESEEVYANKIEDLKKLVEPIERRLREEEARAQEVRELLNCIVDYRMAVESSPSSSKDVVLKECDRAEQWLREKTQLQELLPKNVDPALLSADIRNQIEALHRSCEQVMNQSEAEKGLEGSSGADYR
ncbi:heat shock protein 70 (Hsp 70) family protein [Wolffia australiana]